MGANCSRGSKKVGQKAGKAPSVPPIMTMIVYVNGSVNGCVFLFYNSRSNEKIFPSLFLQTLQTENIVFVLLLSAAISFAVLGLFVGCFQTKHQHSTTPRLQDGALISAYLEKL